MSAVTPHSFAGSSTRRITANADRRAAINRQPNSVSSIVGRSRASDPRISTAANRQPNRIGSIAGRNRVSNPRTSKAANRQTAANRQSFVRNHASERHDGNWHRGWNRHHAHFHHNKVFVFIGGFWWGLDPWFYPYYAYDYPYDYDYGYPYDYYNYDDQPAYDASDHYSSNATISAVQSELGKLGYYPGAIDGILGDQTEAAIARYQEDRDLSVTGTVDAATLQSLGLTRTGS
jgi:Putative peptidoglycan binding domain